MSTSESAAALLRLAEEVEKLAAPQYDMERRVAAILYGEGGRIPTLTVSVDVGLALLAEMLPGYVATVCTYGFASKMATADVYREGHAGRAQARAATPAIALAAALLRAKATA